MVPQAVEVSTLDDHMGNAHQKEAGLGDDQVSTQPGGYSDGQKRRHRRQKSWHQGQGSPTDFRFGNEIAEIAGRFSQNLDKYEAVTDDVSKRVGQLEAGVDKYGVRLNSAWLKEVIARG